MAVLRFRVSGKDYEFDDDVRKLMGSELALIEQHVGDLAEWGTRLTGGRVGYRDILVLTYLASRRAGDARPWDEFIATIAPLTFETVDDAPQVRVAVTEQAQQAATPAPDADLVRQVVAELRARAAS